MATLIHDIQHHAKDKAELVFMLGTLFASELNPLGWQSMRAGKGNNSWRIYLERDGQPTKIWYFTGYEKGEILVRNKYRWHEGNQEIHDQVKARRHSFCSSRRQRMTCQTPSQK